MSHPENQEETPAGRPLLAAIAAIFGVQSERNRRRDFSSQNAAHYLAAFAALVGMLVIVMIILVNVLTN